jgi:hypothetical protein
MGDQDGVELLPAAGRRAIERLGFFPTLEHAAVHQNPGALRLNDIGRARDFSSGCGATILKINGGGQILASFGDIKATDSVAYFGLVGCGTETIFYAFVVVIAGTD